ncbi:Splicing factor 45 [Aphelenchoides fujianensis]|nr:Splicing factor 45 [Aphelenchoides fujianensis]
MSLYDDIEVPSDDEEPQKEAVEAPMVVEEKPKELNPAPPPSAMPAGLSFLKSQLESRKAQLPIRMRSLRKPTPAFKPSPALKPATALKPTPASTSTPASMPPSAFKPAAVLNPTPAFKPSPTVVQQRPAAPVVQTGSIWKTKRVQPLKIDSNTTFSIIPKAVTENSVFLFNEIEVVDEYNPTAPTDYSVYKPKREAQLAKELAAREVAERLEREHAEEAAKRKAGAAIAPPTDLLEQDSVVLEPSTSQPPPPSAPLPRGQVAANIMSRMGFKVGGGLGKNQQGIASALEVKKIGKTSGMILPNPATTTDQ